MLTNSVILIRVAHIALFLAMIVLGFVVDLNGNILGMQHGASIIVAATVCGLALLCAIFVCVVDRKWRAFAVAGLIVYLLLLLPLVLQAGGTRPTSRSNRVGRSRPTLRLTA